MHWGPYAGIDLEEAATDSFPHFLKSPLLRDVTIHFKSLPTGHFDRLLSLVCSPRWSALTLLFCQSNLVRVHLVTDHVEKLPSIVDNILYLPIHNYSLRPQLYNALQQLSSNPRVVLHIDETILYLKEGFSL